MADEDVIKRRLLIDGDGTGDDRRINVLIKSFIKWCNVDDTPENIRTIYDRMLVQLAQCEFAVTKSEFAQQMMVEELKNYHSISDNFNTAIDHAKEQIVKSKETLILAKKIRKNRMEYDVLAKIINQQPDRKETSDKLELLRTELNELEDRRRQLQTQLDVRRNEFTVLMRSIKELQTKLDNDNEQCMDNNSGSNGDDPDKEDDDVIICSPVVKPSVRGKPMELDDDSKLDSPESFTYID